MLTRNPPSGSIVTLQSFPASSAAPASGSHRTIDLSEGPVHRLTLDEDCAITLAGLPAGQAVSGIFLELIQGTGAPNQALILGAKTPDGNGLNLSTGLTARDLIEVMWDGFSLFAWVAGLDMG